MRNLKKSLFVIALSLVTLGVQAQIDPDPHSSADTEKVTYQDYKKMEEAYKNGRISKETLLKVFNQLTDEWDDLCHPQPKRETVEKVITEKDKGKIKTIVIVVSKNDLKSPQVAKN